VDNIASEKGTPIAPTNPATDISTIIDPPKLLYGAKARVIAEGKSQKSLTVILLLEEMHLQNCFYKCPEELHKIEDTPHMFVERQLDKTTLQIVEVVITQLEDERSKFKEKAEKMKEKSRLDLYMLIQDRVLYKMWNMKEKIQKQRGWNRRKSWGKGEANLHRKTFSSIQNRNLLG
jgi:hypothetical protein